MRLNVFERYIVERLKRGPLRSDGVTDEQRATLRGLVRRGLVRFDGVRFELEEPLSCFVCRRPVEEGREWAGTCLDCMAQGCPLSPLDAEKGNPCQGCDCVRPERRRGR